LKSKNGTDDKIGGRSLDSSSALVISRSAIIPWARETKVALDEALEVASYGMKLLDHKYAAQGPHDIVQ
jgi:hypothetical protein